MKRLLLLPARAYQLALGLGVVDAVIAHYRPNLQWLLIAVGAVGGCWIAMLYG